MNLKKLISIMFLCAMASGVWGEPVTLNPDAPQRYEVVRDDTLWDIAGRFLRDPWRWPDIWEVNQQINNPHLIYPGDIIFLSYRENGDPVLELQRGLPGYKMSPTVRTSKLEKAIPTIPIDAIQQFLLHPQVVSKEALDNAPYVVAGAEERLILGAGDDVYVRSLSKSATMKYGIYRGGEVYRDPDHPSTILGYEALFIADANVQRFGDPAILSIQNSTREVLVGDRLLPANDLEFEQHFLPHAPRIPVEGKIIAVIDGVSQIGQYQAVALDLGAEDGVEKGTVLAVYQAGRVVRDPISRLPEDKVRLPDERAGMIMVFRAFDHISYGLMMGAERAIHVYDVVRNP
ncbi:LysM peptidoglycan-binding domain-containing protein [Nitrosococcus watsonii]|uniref:Peptidoglycan-binding lysin domain protein n=1 Tax=Nitrosococcus watsoni (strain C-113) TaxID=105559 RepID=D8KCB8_NITWC|nr:LysM domain-containing protein [Nitrosococcus watsonii]ADJ29789.1 Peptidoglycan-binding lysin domain protein [Nitrosococcus watsonii C-113]